MQSSESEQARTHSLKAEWLTRLSPARYQQCTTTEQKIVYGIIDDSGADGIWSQVAQKKLGMHENVFKTAIKQLISKGLIERFKSVEHPNKKMYIKATLRPSEKASGGPWYTDQFLDEGFIGALERVIYDYIKRQSSYHSKHGGVPSRQIQPKKGIVRGIDKSKKRTADQISGNDSRTRMQGAVKKEMLLPMPAGYMGYPTVRDIARVISKMGITTTTILTEEDVQKLLDVLVYDGLVEPITVADKVGYRVMRVARQGLEAWALPLDADQEESGAPIPYPNAYTEAPCGRCPVFDLCEDGGPVSASSCEYFQRWLGLD
jgi:DNA-directed RNA polymerase III subunit RPC6